MVKRRRLSFSAEIYERYELPDKEHDRALMLSLKIACRPHALNEQIFLDFLYLIHQDQTGWVEMDQFLTEKDLELKRSRAEEEARAVFDRLEHSSRG